MTLDEECRGLYRASREAYLGGDVEKAEELYRRIRAEHGCELFYEVELPGMMRLVHPVGTVLGRATYADWLVVYQGVSVGSTVDGERPTFTGACVLFPGAKVLGNVTVGTNVWITAGTTVQSFGGQPVRVPDHSVVFPAVYVRGDGQHALGCGWSQTKRSVMHRFFLEDEE